MRTLVCLSLACLLGACAFPEGATYKQSAAYRTGSNLPRQDAADTIDKDDLADAMRRGGNTTPRTGGGG
jgi:hypothetical protein